MRNFNSDKEIKNYIEKTIKNIRNIDECRLYREEQLQCTENVFRARNSTEWIIRINKVIEEKKSPDGVSVTEEELKELKPMPFMAMVSSVGSNDEKDMYDYLGGVKNDKRSEELDAAFKQEKSNFSIVIVVDMWITGFDVPCLTYLYNDKPLKKHLLIQTISRVNRKYPRKEYGMVIDYIGIRDNMREAMKVYGGDGTTRDCC